MNEMPIVSILIPNYNYGNYLAACLDSALNQTYENLQVVFVDNHSTDESYDIALDFQARYKDRIRVYRNDVNIGGSQNHHKAIRLMDPMTEYYIFLSSDDLFHPHLVSRSMDIMTNYPSVGFVLCHRNAIDEDGNITREIPFYNCSCVVSGTKQMEVFMMAGIGVATQCFRKRSVELAGETDLSYRFDVGGDWFSNFSLASVADMGYIHEPLCTYRTHSVNVTSQSIKNLTNSLEHILMIHAFNSIATTLERPSVTARLGPSIEKLGMMCLRYGTQLLHENDGYTARRYLHLAPVLKPDITDDPAWQALWRLVRLSGEELRQGLIEFETISPQRRLVSYEPPEGSIRL